MLILALTSLRLLRYWYRTMPAPADRLETGSRAGALLAGIEACGRDWLGRAALSVAGLSWLVLIASWILSRRGLTTLFDLCNLFLLGLAALSLGAGLNRIRHPEERRFWSLMAGAYGLWFFTRLLWLLLGAKGWDSRFDFASDLLYLVSYLSMFLALGTRPHLSPGWSRANRLYQIESVGRAVSVLGLLVYFVAVPHLRMVHEVVTRNLSYALFGALDLLLIAAVVHNYRGARDQKWKVIYLLFGVSFLSLGYGDILEVVRTEGSAGAQTRAGFPVSLLAVLTPLIFLSVIAAGRFRHQFQGIGAGRIEDETDRSLRQERAATRGFWMVAPFLLPAMHFSLYGFDLIQPGLESVHQLIILGTLVLLAILAFLYQRRAELERQAADAQVEANERRFRQLAELLPGMVFETTENGTLTFVNQAATELTGYSEDELTSGFNSQQLLPLEERERVRAAIQAQFEQGVHLPLEVTAVRKDGSRLPVLAQSVPIEENGRVAGIRGILVDISERKHLEAQLLQAQKMEAVGRLAGGVAHDFNNLLTVIKGRTELLADSIKPDDPLQEDLKEIGQASERAAVLTRQLLAFGRKQLLSPQVVILNDVVRGVETMLRRLVGEDVDFVVQLRHPVSCVRIDPGLVEQILMNLVVNARDAMPGGGVITIATAEHEAVEDDQLATGIPRGRFVELSVADTGAGIEESIRDRIFEPFFTTKETGKGTGLGLSMVYGSVKQSQGHIAVESRIGRGSRFRIFLPVHSERSTEGDTRRRAAEGASM